MKHKMKRNNWLKYLQKCIARAYDPNDSYSWADYEKEEVEFIPLDLSAFPRITTETGKMLNKLFTEETTSRTGKYMLKAHSYSPLTEMDYLHCRYYDGDSAHCWGYNDEELLIYEYCEHDTYCTVFKDRESYETGKADMIRWWKEER